MLKVIGNAYVIGYCECWRSSGHCDCCRGARGLKELKGQPFIFVGWFPAVIYEVDNFCEYTFSYVNVHLVW
jgi:hypothetical protein